jgi:hypothetical protein
VKRLALAQSFLLVSLFEHIVLLKKRISTRFLYTPANEKKHTIYYKMKSDASSDRTHELLFCRKRLLGGTVTMMQHIHVGILFCCLFSHQGSTTATRVYAFATAPHLLKVSSQHHAGWGTIINTSSRTAAFFSSTNNNRKRIMCPATTEATDIPVSSEFQTSKRRTVELANQDLEDDDYQGFVRAPLKFIGPYPCLALEFPNLSTPKQRQSDKCGIALDFVLDTAANTNTIAEAIAQELQLERIGIAPGGVGAGGAISAGRIYNLGDCQIDLPKNLPLEVRQYYRPHRVVSSKLEEAKKTTVTNGEREGGDAFDMTVTSAPDNGDAVLLEETTMADESELMEVVLLEEPRPFLFMTNLSASSLPLAAPGSAGLLSNAFLNVFQGGVEFEWHSKELSFPPSPKQHHNNSMDVTDAKASAQSGGGDIDIDAPSTNVTVVVPPSVTFHSTQRTIDNFDKLTAVPIHILKTTNLPSVDISFNHGNGQSTTSPPMIRALLDTGSPITVMNAEAAKMAGIETVEILTSMMEEEDSSPKKKKKGGWNNPLSNMFKGGASDEITTAKARALQRGDLLLVGTGGSGKPTELLKSKSAVSISVQGEGDGAGTVACALTTLTRQPTSIYVGDLPGMKVLGELSASGMILETTTAGAGVNNGDSDTTSASASTDNRQAAAPAVILGMDVLRQMNRMVYTPTMVYFDT